MDQEDYKPTRGRDISFFPENALVLDALANSDYADNTVIVLWSDHGYLLGEKNTFQKHNLWERSGKVPLIVAGPGVPAGHREPGAGLVVAPAVGQADDTRSDRVGHLDRRLHRADPRGHRGRGAVDEPERHGVVGMHLQRAAWLALHEHRDVVGFPIRHSQVEITVPIAVAPGYARGT